MKPCYFLLMLLFYSCETNQFDSDKRQILAKDEIRRSLPRHASNFDVESFKEDTLPNFTDSIKHPLRYKLHFTYTDSVGTQQRQTGLVVFAPDGASLLTSQIVHQP